MRRRFWPILLVLLLLVPLIVWGNSAEPPSFVIIVPGADDTLSVTIEDNLGRKNLSERKDKFSESYYLFYLLSDAESYELLVKTDGVENRIPLPKYGNYNNLYTLDTDSLTLTQGKMPFRTIFFTIIRVVITLFIEGVLLYLFGYRKKITYILFFVINIITQMILAWYLYRQVLDLNSLFGLGLFVVEIIIMAIEALFFSLFIKEHRISRGLLYVFVANLLSFVAGFMLLRHLPF